MCVSSISSAVIQVNKQNWRVWPNVTNNDNIRYYKVSICEYIILKSAWMRGFSIQITQLSENLFFLKRICWKIHENRKCYDCKFPHFYRICPSIRNSWPATWQLPPQISFSSSVEIMFAFCSKHMHKQTCVHLHAHKHKYTLVSLNRLTMATGTYLL